MNEVKGKILIVEDDLDVADMLDTYFCVQGYDVTSCNLGKEALETCRVSPPDVVILDIHLPDIDGFEIARQLHLNELTAEIPIIFLTGRTEHLKRLQWLELGADNYMAKPTDIHELHLRVRHALERSSTGSLSNQVTSLPEGTPVDDHLSTCVQSSDWGILLIRVKNLEAYTETYGLSATNDVMRAIGSMMQGISYASGCQENYLGHLAKTDLLLITRLEYLAGLQESMRAQLTSSLEYFYPIKDRNMGNLQARKLNIKICVLRSDQAEFSTPEALKAALLNL